MLEAFFAKISKAPTQLMLRLTLYEMMRSSPDFEDVKLAFNDRTSWSIELFRSCFPIHLTNGYYFFMLCTLSFLIIAETMQVQYGRLPPAKLKEHAEGMGLATFALFIAVLDVGSIIIRITALVALSGDSKLAVSLVLVSISPSVVLPLLTHAGKLAKQRKRPSDGEELPEV